MRVGLELLLTWDFLGFSISLCAYSVIKGFNTSVTSFLVSIWIKEAFFTVFLDFLGDFYLILDSLFSFISSVLVFYYSYVYYLAFY